MLYSILKLLFAAKYHPHPEISLTPGPPGADGQDLTSMIGEVRMFAGSSPDSGWLICDGSEILRSSALGQVISTTFGVGNGSTTCNLPDLRQRFPVGAGAATSLWDYSLGQQGGTESHQLTVGEMPSHAHLYQKLLSSTSGGNIAVGSAQLDGAQGSTTYEGGNTEHNNVSPFTALNFIIYAGE